MVLRRNRRNTRFSRMTPPYERFEAWKACHQLVLATYRATARFPDAERYGLTSQARRAAFSAAANIVEGCARRGSKEFRRFLDISMGSLYEVEYIIRLSRELGMLDETEANRLAGLHTQASRLTWKLYASMTRRSTNPPAA